MARRSRLAYRGAARLRPKTHPSDSQSRSRPRRPSTKAGRVTRPDMLRSAGSAVGKVLQKSTEVVKEAGATWSVLSWPSCPA
jgi:hypothetical protein